MKRHIILTAAFAALGAVLSLSPLAHAGLNPSNHSEWDEDYYYSGFGGSAPNGAVEYSVGFSTIADFDGRVLSNAAVTKNFADGSPLTTISTFLFSGTDANLYKISVTDPATFSATLPAGSGNILAVFSAGGNALAASVGGTTITAASAGITTPGIYYVGLADTGGYPENAGGQNIFGLSNSSTAGVYTPVVGDSVLATDPSIAWTFGGAYAPGLLQNSSFFSPSSTITLTGSAFAVVPEPASMGLIAVGGLGLLARRRKARA